MSQPFEVPPALEAHLEERLQSLSFSLHQPEKLAGAIRKLSNLFLKGANFGDYWHENDFRAAYIAYYSVLNFLRARSVFQEARLRGFFEGIKSVTDWGCGAGAAVWAFLSEWPVNPSQPLPEIIAVDQSAGALDEYKMWMDFFAVKTNTLRSSLDDLEKTKSDTLILSYVLNEVEDWPEIPKHVDKLILIEPSTHQAGRRLLSWRDDLLKTKEWFAWAPCTHQEPCPLLNQSGKDWCHHRIHWTKPQWFFDLEKHLPMRNDTLTLTYLLLSKNPAPENLKGRARVVGDEQEEKGKTRQMICRGPNREFLSWLHRDQISLKLKRGDIINIGNHEQRASELRIYMSEDVTKFSE